MCALDWSWLGDDHGDESLGLLDARRWVQQRDPALFGVLVMLLNGAAIAEVPRTEFLWRLEARCFVFFDKGVLPALVVALRESRLATQQFITQPDMREPREIPLKLPAIVAALRADDFWIPDGDKPLDQLIQAFDPAAAPAGPANAPVQPVSDDDLRRALKPCGWSWKRMLDVHSYRGNGAAKANLGRYIAFRKELTDRLMAESVNAAVARYRHDLRPFRWIRYAIPGSVRLTSDIDVNMRGSATEFVTQEFNRRFRDWTVQGETRPDEPLESGFVFDINVYAQDYTRELGRRFLLPDQPDPDIWPEAAAQREEAEAWQDKYALLKIRRYMPEQTWGEFCDRLIRRLAGAAAVAQSRDRLRTVDELWHDEQAAINAALQSARTGYPDNDLIRAQNNLYLTQLETVFNIRRAIATGSNLDQHRVGLARQLGRAMFLAQEAYHSSGAVRDIVCNLQMGQGLQLTLVEKLNSFNEQIGDVWKELSHAPQPEDTSVSIEVLVQASEYLHRLARAALAATYDTVAALLAACPTERQEALRNVPPSPKRRRPV